MTKAGSKHIPKAGLEKKKKVENFLSKNLEPLDTYLYPSKPRSSSVVQSNGKRSASLTLQQTRLSLTVSLNSLLTIQCKQLSKAPQAGPSAVGFDSMFALWASPSIKRFARPVTRVWTAAGALRSCHRAMMSESWQFYRACTSFERIIELWTAHGFNTLCDH